MIFLGKRLFAMQESGFGIQDSVYQGIENIKRS